MNKRMNKEENTLGRGNEKVERNEREKKVKTLEKRKYRGMKRRIRKKNWKK